MVRPDPFKWYINIYSVRDSETELQDEHKSCVLAIAVIITF